MTRRHSLLTRLLAMSVVVAGCSVGASAWLAAQSTSGAINQEIGESLATDAEIYDLLLAHAATHVNWSGVRALVKAGGTARLEQLKRDVAQAWGNAHQPRAVHWPLAIRATIL